MCCQTCALLGLASHSVGQTSFLGFILRGTRGFCIGIWGRGQPGSRGWAPGLGASVFLLSFVYTNDGHLSLTFKPYLDVASTTLRSSSLLVSALGFHLSVASDSWGQ